MSNYKSTVIVKKFKYDPAAYEQEVKERLSRAIVDLPLKAIAKFIDTEVKNLTQLTAFTYQATCFLHDGAYALNRAILDTLGFSSQKEVGPSKNPPETLDVTFADGRQIKVPWGTIAIPGMGDGAEISMGYDYDDRKFTISGKCEKQYVGMMDAIISLMREYLAKESIYRGQAIRLDSDLQPTFLDLSHIDGIPMYLAADTKFAIQPVLARIENTEMCRQQKLSLKFGALLAGPYGTGKTLLAFKLAKRATLNDWTFIYLADPTKTTQMLEIAGQLSTSGNGVVTFVEDIDRVLSGERRTDEINKILNIIDGGDTKSQPVIAIFSTNHIKRINRTFIRGKRTGVIIPMGALDQETAVTFIKEYLGESLVGPVDDAAKHAVSLSVMPSFMAEILDSVKANMIFRETKTVDQAEVKAAIDAYRVQMEMAQLNDDDETPEQKVLNLVRSVLVSDGAYEALVNAKLAKAR